MTGPPGPGPHPGLPCPAWCRRPHAVDDHPDDRLHQSQVHVVAVVTGHPALESDDTAVGAWVTVRLVRRPGSAVTWLEVRSEEGSGVHLVVTAESARRLLAMASGLLDATAG